MILLLGGTGYIGSAFARAMEAKQVPHRIVSRKQHDYTNRDRLIELIQETKATFLINAAGFTGKPNVDACELHKAECLAANAVLPGTIRQACEHCDLPWGHVSSGCIYTGTRPDGSGFRETDPPNFCFRTNNCSWYSGCKALGEEVLEGAEKAYIWRMRIPFNNIDSPRNYLAKLLTYERLLDVTNSMSHLEESVDACLQCWTREVPTGIYHVTNTGAMTTREVVSILTRERSPDRTFDFFENEAEFLASAVTTPRSHCELDNSKLISRGILLRDIHDAMEQSVAKWKSAGVVA